MFLFQLPILPHLYLRRADFAFVDWFYRRWSPGSDFPNSVVESVKETFRQPGVAGAALSYYRNLPDFASRLGRESWPALLARVRIPRLVITGEKDGCVDTRAMNHMELPKTSTWGHLQDELPIIKCGWTRTANTNPG